MNVNRERVYEVTIQYLVSRTCQVAASCSLEAKRLAFDSGLAVEVDFEEIKDASIVRVHQVK